MAKQRCRNCEGGHREGGDTNRRLEGRGWPSILPNKHKSVSPVYPARRIRGSDERSHQHVGLWTNIRGKMCQIQRQQRSEIPWVSPGHSGGHEPEDGQRWERGVEEWQRVYEQMVRSVHGAVRRASQHQRSDSGCGDGTQNFEYRQHEGVCGRPQRNIPPNSHRRSCGQQAPFRDSYAIIHVEGIDRLQIVDVQTRMNIDGISDVEKDVDIHPRWSMSHLSLYRGRGGKTVDSELPPKKRSAENQPVPTVEAVTCGVTSLVKSEEGVDIMQSDGLTVVVCGAIPRIVFNVRQIFVNWVKHQIRHWTDIIGNTHYIHRPIRHGLRPKQRRYSPAVSMSADMVQKKEGKPSPVKKKDEDVVNEINDGPEGSNPNIRGPYTLMDTMSGTPGGHQSIIKMHHTKLGNRRSHNLCEINLNQRGNDGPQQTAASNNSDEQPKTGESSDTAWYTDSQINFKKKYNPTSRVEDAATTTQIKLTKVDDRRYMEDKLETETTNIINWKDGQFYQVCGGVGHVERN
ncbi:hypothetical protein C8R44DRAFT_740222 [Mycena epipterygia]|nr:hypothetical protein C8R44DRAFT_740222 [Mycena epipterygia]